MAAEAVLHDSLEARSGDALQQAVIALLCVSLGSQHSRYQCLQNLPAHNKQTSCHLAVTPLVNFTCKLMFCATQQRL